MIVVPTDRKIWLYGPALDNVESEYVEKEEYAQLPELRAYMLSLMKGFGAIGIAAPQVGVFKQFALVTLESGRVIDLINPEIIQMRGKEIVGIESCLSVPPAGNDCRVARQETITVECRMLDEGCMMREVVLSKRDAVVAQHEMDHLTGTFFFDRASNTSKQRVLESYEKWKLETNRNVKDDPRKLPNYCF